MNQSLTYNQYKWRIFLIAIALHLMASFFSEGYHKLDEHDGIVISTSYLLGDVAKEALSPGETKAMIRSWLQPSIYAFFLLPLKKVGLSNPFTITFIMRIINMLLGLFALYKISDLINPITSHDKERKLYVSVLFLFWLFPFLHVRTTSESLSGIFYVLALSLIVKKLNLNILEAPKSFIKNKKFQMKLCDSFAIGFLFSLSFTIRIQMAIMVFFTCLWLLFYTELKIKSLFFITLSFFITLLAVSLVDYQGYDFWTFPPYNNYLYNTFQGVASSLGTDPFWRYLEKSFLKLIPPYSILILISLFWLWFKRKLSFISVVTFSYFFLHSLIPHKELRFLFPIVYFIPFALTYFVLRFYEHKAVRYLYKVSIFINIILLLKVVIAPAYSGIGLFKTLYNHKVSHINTFEDLPRNIPFYSYENKLETSSIATLDEARTPYIFTRSLIRVEEMSMNNSCGLIYSNYPYAVVHYLSKSLMRKSKVLFLFKCTNSEI